MRSPLTLGSIVPQSRTLRYDNESRINLHVGLRREHARLQRFRRHYFNWQMPEVFRRIHVVRSATSKSKVGYLKLRNRALSSVEGY